MNKKYELNRKLAAQKQLSLTNLDLWNGKQGTAMHHQIKNNIREVFSRIRDECSHYICRGEEGNVDGIAICYNNVDMKEYEYACDDK